MDPNSEAPVWTRIPVLPRRFCIGITIHKAMYIIAWSFFILGIVMLVGFFTGFWVHNYYSSQGEDLVKFVRLKLTMKIEQGYILSILVTTGLSFGILMDMLLLYAFAKFRLGLQVIWAMVLVLRMVFWVAVGSMLWGRCVRGGRMCDVLLPASMMWVSSLGVFSVVIVVTYSHVFYLYYDQWVASVRESGKEDLSSTTTSTITTTTTSSSEETTEDSSV